MNRHNRMFGLVPVFLLLVCMSSFYQHAEGQRSVRRPWSSFGPSRLTRQKLGQQRVTDLNNRGGKALTHPFIQAQIQSERTFRNQRRPSNGRAKQQRTQNRRTRPNRRPKSKVTSTPIERKVAPRAEKTLRNTFPFSAALEPPRHNANHQDNHHHHHHHHEEEDTHKNNVQSSASQRFSPRGLDNRASRQGSGNDVAIDIGSIAAAGERCVDKVVMVQETEYDDVITCKHSYSQKCHITYATDFTPQQEEKCEESFKKSCFIEYKDRASEETVQFCFTPLVKNCDIPGPEECSTEFESHCITRYHEHEVEDDVVDCVDEVEEKCESKTQGYSTSEECTKWPIRKCSVEKKDTKKYSPQTECKKIPIDLCGPGACPVEPGAEECQERRQTVVQEVPEETCNLEPQRICKHVTKLVPHLKPRENCIDIPKEVCSRSRTNPRKVDKPVIKKWCYTTKGAPPPTQPPPPPSTPRKPRPPQTGDDEGIGKITQQDLDDQCDGCVDITTINACLRATQNNCDLEGIVKGCTNCNKEKFEAAICQQPQCQVSQCGYKGGCAVFDEKPTGTYLPPQPPANDYLPPSGR